MDKLEFSKEYFNIYDTLSCGQTFRYNPFKDGYLVVSNNVACYIVYENENTVIYTEHTDYFKNYFDLNTDYSLIVDKSKSYNINYLTKASEYGKGIRILKQNTYEMIISFIISQNNNITRIKTIIKKLCEKLGDKLEFMGETYYSFPTIDKLALYDEGFFKSLGFGYRAGYIESTAKKLLDTDINSLYKLDTKTLKSELIKFKGIGGKVADCVLLFGFNRFDSFPVDTWIYKLYRENFCGEECNREKITEYFLNMFKEYSGYIQQYLFYYKRENKEA